MLTLYCVPFLALIVQVELFSALTWPMIPLAWPDLDGTVGGGAVPVGVLWLPAPPEQAAKLIANAAPTIPIDVFAPTHRRPSRVQSCVLIAFLPSSSIKRASALFVPVSKIASRLLERRYPQQTFSSPQE
jgi:hypothetical protein